MAVITLALGIGINTTVFTAYDAVALRDLPVSDPATLVRASRSLEKDGGSDLFSFPEYAYVRDHTRSFVSVVAGSALVSVPATISAGTTETVQVRLVSPNLFDALGVAPSRGRTFMENEESPAVVLSYPFWKKRFSADAAVVGRTITLNQTTFTVIGVGPALFLDMNSPPQIPDAWVPLAFAPRIEPGPAWLSEPDAGRLQIGARLHPGVAREQAQAELGVLVDQFAKSFHPVDRTTGVNLARARLFNTSDGAFDVFRTVIMVLLAAVSMILLIGCVNLVNVLLARASARQKEIAIRLAVGASRLRLLRQLCTETVLLGLAGGAVGMILSMWICHLLWIGVQQLMRDLGVGLDNFFLDFRPDARIFFYTLAVSITTGLLVGLAPALRASRADLTAALKQEFFAPLARSGRFRIHLRDTLAAAQIAFCLTLLVGAGLLAMGTVRLSHVDPGFETGHVILMSAGSVGKIPAEQMAQRVASVPLVKSTALCVQPPFLGHSTSAFQPEGRTGEWFRSLYNTVTPEYFATLGIPVLRGRTFTQQESKTMAPVAVISEATASRFWPGEDPIGKRLRTSQWASPNRLANREMTVVGVVKTIRGTNLSKVDPSYLYFAGSPSELATVLVRTEGPTAAVFPAIREALGSVDRRLPTQAFIMALDKAPLKFQRLMSELPAVAGATLGGIALLLAAIGIYGIISFAVTQRTREIGIRISLGAQRSGVIKMVLLQALRPVAIGGAVGLVGSMGLSKLFAAMIASPETPDLLFGSNPWNPVAFGAVLLVLMAVTALASALPANRAAKVDPLEALRYE